jgi:predicted HAD superfamily Cof-like phosphohydrolase
MEDLVRAFHEKYGHLVSKQPTTLIPESVKDLRKELISEEYEELLEAIELNSLTDIADGAADLIYVIIGTCLSYGIPIERIFREVHNSNMTKTAIKAESGQKYGTKTPKGPDYKAPDIHRILFNPKTSTLLETLNS